MKKMTALFILLLALPIWGSSNTLSRSDTVTHAARKHLEVAHLHTDTTSSDSATIVNLNVTGTFSGSPVFSGAASINGTLDVGGATTLGSTLTVSGAAVFSDAASINSTLSAAATTVTTFTSTGIDDNATSEILQITDSGATVAGDFSATDLDGILGSNSAAAATVTTLGNNGALTLGGGALTYNTAEADLDVRFAATGATNALFIQGSEGNVGIGTATPGAKLSIQGNGARIAVTDDSVPTNAVNLGTDTSGNGAFQMYDAAGVQRVNFYSHGTAAAASYYITNGNVGIGTTSPSVLFELADAGTNSGACQHIWTYNDQTGYPSNLSLRKSHSDTKGTLTTTIDTEWIGSIDFRGVGSGNAVAEAVRIKAVQNGAAGASYVPTDLIFETYTNSGINTNQFVLATSGNVGIGVTPANRLDVLTDVASDYVGRFFNDGNNANRYGIQVQCGADDASGTTTYFQALDGDGGEVGKIQNINDTFTFVDGSDRRTKDDIEDTEVKGLETLKKLRVIDYNSKANDLRVKGAFVAQEVKQVYPQAVSGDSTDLRMVVTPDSTKMLIEAIHQDTSIVVTLDSMMVDSSLVVLRDTTLVPFADTSYVATQDTTFVPAMMGVAITNFIPLLVKAVQEQQDQIDGLFDIVAHQQQQIDSLKTLHQ